MNKSIATLFILSILSLLFFVSVSAAEEPAQTDSVKYRFAPIVVTGQRYEMPLKDVAASISIISPSKIKGTHLNTVADAISYGVPGVYTTRKSHMGYGVSSLAAGNITIRGIGSNPNSQVLILIDGRPDFQGIFSHPINDAYLLSNVDHIEVLRGPASAVYGTNALGGVVNIITQKFPVSGFHTTADIGYGSYNTHTYVIQHSGRLDAFQYILGVGYNTTDGHRDNSELESQNYSVKLGYQFNHHFDLTFNSTVTPYTFHDPGPDGIDLRGYFDSGDITRYSMDMTLSNTYARTDGTIKIHGNFGKHDLSDGWTSEDETKGIIAFQNFHLPHETKTTVGFDMKRFGGESQLSGSPLGTYFNDEYAGYIHLQKVLLEKMIAALGVRFENNSHFGHEWIPKCGVVYHPLPKTALRTSLAKGFRTPTIKDLYLFPPANAHLKPERLWNYELGVNQSIGNSLTLDVCGFYYEGDQFIETVIVAPGQMQNQNVGSNSAKGFEMTINGKLLRNLSGDISCSYLESDNIIPYSPNKVNFHINYSMKKLHLSFYGEHISNLYTSYQLDQLPPTTTIEKVSDYTLVHMKLHYPLSRQLRLSLGVENLFEESYHILKGYPMPGRTLFSNVTYSL